MIWKWIKEVFIWIAMMVIPQQPPPAEPYIDPHQKCLVCGSRDNLIEAVTVIESPGKQNSMRNTVAKVTCRVCGGSLYLPPVMKVEDQNILTGKYEVIGKAQPPQPPSRPRERK